MAENVKALRRRLRSIKNTKQITRAMEMVSAAKLRRSQEQLTAGRPYAGKLQELLGRLSASASISHPLFEKRPVQKRLLVVITADRGLAGSFNAQIIKRAENFMRQGGGQTELALVGKKGYDYFKNRKWPISWSVVDLGGKLSADRSNEIAQRLMDEFLSGKTDEVNILYNAFVSTLVYRPTLEKLLPLDPDALLGEAAKTISEKKHIDYLLEPDSDRLFASLLPRFVRSKIYISLAETFTAEHSARMVAMSGATKNCQELIDAVSLQMNKARQASITKEILEIVGGAEALKG
jgi:F-type H+-transporting ATPase subunit gamma